MLKNIPLYAVVIICCGGSMICSIIYYAGEHESLFNKILFGSFAGALDLAKYIFFAYAATLTIQEAKKAPAIKFLAFLFLIVSIYGTVAFMESGGLQKERQANSESFVFKSMVQTIQDREKQIATINKNMDRDQSLDFRERAIEQSDKLNQIQTEKANAIKQLINLKVKPISGGNSIFSHVSKITRLSKETIRQVYFIFFAVLVELAGIYCLLLISLSPKKEGLEVEVKKDNVKRKPKKVFLTEEQEPIANRILAGDYGKELKVTEIMKAEKVGHIKIKNIIRALAKMEKVEITEGRAALA